MQIRCGAAAVIGQAPEPINATVSGSQRTRHGKAAWELLGAVSQKTCLTRTGPDASASSIPGHQVFVRGNEPLPALWAEGSLYFPARQKGWFPCFAPAGFVARPHLP